MPDHPELLQLERVSQGTHVRGPIAKIASRLKGGAPVPGPINRYQSEAGAPRGTIGEGPSSRELGVPWK